MLCTTSFGFGLLSSSAILCASAAVVLVFLGGFVVRTRCPSMSKLRLGFFFPSIGSVAALALVGAIV